MIIDKQEWKIPILANIFLHRNAIFIQVAVTLFYMLPDYVIKLDSIEHLFIAFSSSY